MSDVHAADLEAIGDVCDWLIEQADGLPTDRAIELLEAARAAEVKLKMAISLLESQIMGTIEQPVLVGSTVWAKKPQFKKRPDQALICRVVAEKASQPDENGEVRSAWEAATYATDMMKGLYVSPSTLPKVGGVKALGLDMDAVCNDEHTGFELRRTEI